QPFYPADLGAEPGSRFLVDELSAGSTSDQTTFTGSFTMPFSRWGVDLFRRGSSCTIQQHFCLQNILITETDTISLLDIPPTLVSVNADDADVIIERNKQYSEVCRNRGNNEKYVERAMQTLNGATKNKQIQNNLMLMVDTGLIQDNMFTIKKYSTLQNMPSYMLFFHCPTPVYIKKVKKVITMIFSDPDRLVKPKEGEQSEAETSCSPALQCLWVFRCELSRGCRVSSMAWNKKNPDLLAVGYGETDYRNHEQGLVCCWSIKNPTWPERIINCDSAVTTVDFSSNSPGQLAVGMSDGSIAIHNVQSADNKSPFISSRECAKRHLGPVWQLRWNQQELSFTGEEKVESLYSVGADGRICKWFVINCGLDCTDLMKLKKMNNTLRKTEQNKPEKTAECVLSVLTPGLCFDFHPSDSNIYLTGTWEGNIHKCSCSNGHQFLETYRKHFCPVNCITWCPLHPDVFLSCSSDSTIQLWKQDCINPLLSFTSNQPVAEVRWSPKHATVFGAVNEERLEIWDLNSSFLDPVIVQPAAPGLKMTSLLFASLTDCVVVGDSDGQVTAYQLQNLHVGESSQGDVIQGLLHSASPKELQETLM
uniref:Dynein axonemal intermediate chain 4 n=1 Tax=Xiphophorus couchianus TaxID=32473 RepID=A0A3B5LH66_9TELE